MSWLLFKKSTYAPDPLYMGAVFNCHDSMKAGLKYKKEFPSNKYYLVQFEDLLMDTKKVLVDIFEFLELSHDHNLLTTLSWVDPKGKPWGHNSSFMDRDDNTMKFDKQEAIERWRLHLTDKDIALCEAINGQIMETYGYKCSNVMIEWNEIIEKVISEDTLTRYLRNWICEGKGVEEFPTDPLKAENWAENN